MGIYVHQDYREFCRNSKEMRACYDAEMLRTRNVSDLIDCLRIFERRKVAGIFS